MTEKKANKHELRTRETRDLLLAAAETVFTRDGYEGAELGEIATLAGRTKGAIYAQFKSKEDIFLALVESRSLHHRARMQEALARSTTLEGNLAATRAFMLQMSKEREWTLLLLEFKLFSIRRPESQARLQSFYATVYGGNEERRYMDAIGPAPGGISRTDAIHALPAMITGLLLEHAFDPAHVGEEAIERVVGEVFDTLFL
ncbi:transcriptional regulator, TetR family [Granulicella rosea]|uniref:Transcriptional regulator, TetR family n=1 Tax=Granulicella rosea TaxID=474952 RepID=A0A239CQC8_9BACT|nr:TetR/AcrR family transcriptional regulator [Granulicella rosea]SNS22052.1 transcriptional regulator, TetR family [Granulicella rosea]